MENDKIGDELKELILDARKRDVEVRIIYDAFGSRSIKNNIAKELRKAGVKIFPIIKIKFVGLANRLNHRDHRKIVVVVDSKIAFVGGINVANEYDNRCENDRFWRDTHIKIEGDTVNNLQLHFISNWNICSDDILEVNNKYFPTLFTTKTYDNSGFAQIIAAGAD